MHKTPPYLKVGDAVILVSPAGKVDGKKVQNAKFHLESWGLKVELGDHSLGAYHYFSGSDLQRKDDFQYALNNPEIKAIFCTRGGYGSIRILDQLDFTLFMQQPKWIVGFSDITVFHSQLSGLGIPSVHGMMPVQFPEFPLTNSGLESLKKALFGEPLTYTLDHHSLNRQGSAMGILVGGNLSILYSLLGDKICPDFSDKILFLEDVGEYHYHLDRMMMAIRRKGVFDQIKGLIVGAFNEMKEGETPFGSDYFTIISEIVKSYSFPVCFNFPAGHITDNHTLVFNSLTNISVKQKKSIIKNNTA